MKSELFAGMCLGLIISSALTMLWTFGYAYLIGDYIVTIDINHYGEAHLEFIIWLFTVIVAIPYTLYYYVEGVKNKGERYGSNKKIK